MEPANFTVGANVQFECYEGFRTSDTLLLTCQSDSNWSADGPRCEGNTLEFVIIMDPFQIATCTKYCGIEFWYLFLSVPFYCGL